VTFAEISAEAKHGVRHRGRAMARAILRAWAEEACQLSYFPVQK